LGTYFGGVIVMALFVLCLYVNFKDKSLIYMSCYLICLAGVVGSVTGVAGLLVFSDSPELGKTIRIFWLSVAMVCTLLFGVDYLETKKHMPRLHQAFLGASACCAVIPLLIFVVPFFYLIQITLLFGLVITILAASASTIMLRKRYVPAIYYSIAWVWFFAGGVANIGRAFSLLPINTWTEYGFQWGSMVSIVCLALGIASKFNLERAHRLKMEKVASEEKHNRLRAQIIAQQEQFKSEQAEAESKAKGEFLANMSHEIRTPMNGVLGITQLLKDTSLNSIQKNFVSTIETSGKTLLGVLNDILDYSKIESGKFDIEKIPVKPTDIVINTIELFKLKANDKGVDIACKIDDDVPDIIASDPTRLSQILLNLTSNAFKFTHKGGITIQVSMADSEHILFEVIDTGIGLSEDQQAKLFKSFSQADQSTTRKYGGTGLGLYISKSLTELMGGEIGVKSVLNEGANFWFTVEINQAILEDYSEGEIASLSVDEIIQQSDFSNLSVLVAEDNSVNQMVIKGLLNKVGITPLIVENGAECVSTVMDGSSEFNCILMDCEMPEMDGYEATTRIREMKLSNALYIVGLSGNAMKEHEEKAYEAGMDYYLRKPVEFSALLDTLNQLANKLDKPQTSIKQSAN
ncbi:MAG: ATP-binding protein, partial [Pseudomonadales bacterium]|nr:ATP-binding protein [Pseudomonadales bacterium]